ncbi:MAG: 2-dehydropantoate 2-reductase [Rhodospirillaceae bacterium]|nr:2-dehydropantoate 2-reductase [Rhodospirillaceae bacterium]MDD9928962.1 2-dehydropantoate 2-reductase [Rhodospirillaceae bacterium]
MTNSPIVIWGSGAIGGSVGAFMARAGEDVLFVDRVADHVAAMNETGLRISGPIAEFTTPVRAVTDDAIEGTFDTVFLCVKGQDTVAAVEALKPHLAEDGCVVSLQNGLNEPVIADLIGVERTVGAFINFGADYHGAGHIFYGGRSAVVVGEVDNSIRPRTERLHRLLKIFEENAILTDNISGYLWSKMGYISLLFATAMVDATIDEVMASEPHRPLLEALAREVMSVAEAKGLTLEGFDPYEPSGFTKDADAAATRAAFETMVDYRNRSEKRHSGMWRDIAVRKRKTEVNQLLVPMVEEADAQGVPVPLNKRMIELVYDIEEGRRPQSWDNLSVLEAEMG